MNDIIFNILASIGALTLLFCVVCLVADYRSLFKRVSKLEQWHSEEKYKQDN